MRQFLLLLSLLIFAGCQTAQNPTSELATQDTETQTVIEQIEPIATEEVAQSENSDVSVEQKTYDHSKIAVPSLDDAWNKMDAEYVGSSEPFYTSGWKLPEQVALVELIVQGTITEISESFYIDSQWTEPVTPVKFLVDDVLFGLDVEKEITVYYYGGEVTVATYLEHAEKSDGSMSVSAYSDLTDAQKQTERIAYYTDNTIPPEVGQNLVLFLDKSADFPDGYRLPYDGLSVYFVDEQAQGIANPYIDLMTQNSPDPESYISRLYLEELEWYINLKEEWVSDNAFFQSPTMKNDPDLQEKFEKNAQIDVLWREKMESNP